MNRISAVTLLPVASLETCGRAIAQQPTIKANIPFNFTVGNTWVPAGEYTVTLPSQHVVQLQSADHTRTAVDRELSELQRVELRKQAGVFQSTATSTSFATSFAPASLR